MKVLVTGCHGYLGSVLVGMLRSAGHSVVGLDCDYFKPCLLGPAPAEVAYLVRDVRDVQLQDLRGIEAVVHLAALSNDPLGNLNAQWTRDINELATLHLARLAKQAGVSRFIFSSSCSSYGASEGEDLLDESAPLNPVTPYGRSKVAAEAGLAELSDDSFCVVMLRNATAYGFSPRLRLDLVINELVAMAYLTGRITILSDGTPWRPLVHLEDICRAILSTLDAPTQAVWNQSLNVGRTDENYRVRELADIVQQVVGDCRIEYAPGGGPDKRCYRVKCDRIGKLVPGFQPRWTVRLGVEQLLEAYRTHGLTMADLEGARFRRLPTLKRHLEEGRLDDSLRCVVLSEGMSAAH